MKYTVWYLLFVLSTLPHLFSLPSYFLSFNLVFAMSMTHCRSSTSPPPPHPTIPHCTPPSDSYLQSDTSELTTDLSEPTQRTRDVRLFWQTLFFRPLKLWLMPLSSNPDWNLTSRWPGCCFNDVFPWMSRWDLGSSPAWHARVWNSIVPLLMFHETSGRRNITSFPSGAARDGRPAARSPPSPYLVQL